MSQDVNWSPGDRVYYNPGNIMRHLLEFLPIHGEADEEDFCNFCADNGTPYDAMRWNGRKHGTYFECTYCGSTEHGLECPDRTRRVLELQEWNNIRRDNDALDEAFRRFREVMEDIGRRTIPR